jgi:GR25 family glycosyltransferase involved in LPS biosynthesis
MRMAYLGYYINLDRSPDRRAAMEAQLGRFDLTERYRRFQAVDGALSGYASPRLTPGELGCFASHHQLLRQNLDCASHLHIIEDDVVLASCTANVVEQIVGSAMIDDYDLLFTDMAVPVDFKFYREARTRYGRQVHRPADGTATTVEFSLFPYISCTASYVVNRRSIGLVCKILERELENGASEPIDLTLRVKVAEGRLRAKCLFPFITSVVPGKFANTVARGGRDALSDLTMDLVRHSFFVECDQAATMALAEQRLAGAGADFHGRLLACVFGFMSSNAFQQP